MCFKRTLASLKTDLRDLEQRLTIRMGGMLIALAGFLAIIRFFA